MLNSEHFSTSEVQPVLSIVVTTFDRAAWLSICLQSLCDQVRVSPKYEILVIDNNSTDETKVISKQFEEKSPRIHYFNEPEQGASNARNRGWREAHGQYVAYTDDDCKFPPNWISVACELIERTSFSIYCGPENAYYLSPKPCWYKDSYGSRDFGPIARKLLEDEFPRGGNMIIKQSILISLDGFNARMGPVGHQFAYGEETDLFKRIHSKLPEEIFYYDPNLYLYHLVTPKKMSIPWIIKSNFSMGRSNYLIIKKNAKINQLGKPDESLPTVLWRLMMDLLRGIFFRDRMKYPYWQNYLVERLSRYIRGAGTLYQRILS